MKRYFSFLFFAVLFSCMALRAAELPRTVQVQGQLMHVQGIALDAEKGFMYYSFTTRFVKTDLSGRILGSIEHIQGHLGAMTFDPERRRVFCSLECKDDAIGQGIAKKLDVQTVRAGGSTFYIAVIDVDAVDRVGMDSENNPAFRTVCLREVGKDYHAVLSDGRKHRYACSGIDGVTLAPRPGSFKMDPHDGDVVPDGKMWLWVAYGIYRDPARNDNDCNVLLLFDPDRLVSLARTVTFGDLHRKGPSRAAARYHVFTGNTNWGVQNLAYDPFTRRVYLFVYKGSKSWYPNYDLFAVPTDQMPVEDRLPGFHGDRRTAGKKLFLSLAEDGLSAEVVKPAPGEVPSGAVSEKGEKVTVRGWRFRWGSTGACPLGDGRWYLSEQSKDPVTGKQSSLVRLYRWTGLPDSPFRPQ